MKSKQVLFEMFMPEARFPDEKFWDKDDNAIHPDPKGPPKGTKGVTHRELGYWDADDREAGDDSPGDPDETDYKQHGLGPDEEPNMFNSGDSSPPAEPTIDDIADQARQAGHTVEDKPGWIKITSKHGGNMIFIAKSKKPRAQTTLVPAPNDPILQPISKPNGKMNSETQPDVGWHDIVELVDTI